jgi:hypothetical protein
MIFSSSLSELSSSISNKADLAFASTDDKELKDDELPVKHIKLIKLINKTDYIMYKYLLKSSLARDL